MTDLSGSFIIAKAVKEIGIEQIFGIVGVPITNVVVEMQKLGLPFYGFRNEQAAGYAASVVGYLTRRPAICFTVSGPGMVHAVPGAMNALANCWPMILMASSTSIADVERGGFQETPQIEAAQLYCKRVYSVPNIESFPSILESAVKESVTGRPGPVYIQIPANVMISTSQRQLKSLSPLREFQPGCGAVTTSPRETVMQALQLLMNAKKPVVIGGKGAAYARCEGELAKFIKTTGIPFLSSPMGKGLLPDDDEHVVSPARSVALKGADVVLIIGARLNWMFSFGQAPTFSPNVKFIIIDVSAEQSSKNVDNALSLVGDAQQILTDMNALLPSLSIKPSITEWWSELTQKMQENHKSLNELLSQPQKENEYLTYHQVFNVLRNHLPRNTLLINEGANTMDIGRVCLPQYEPRSRLDSGTLATMGVGVGYAIAASGIYGNSRPVVCIQGDSAFGFSGMEIEVACRFHMPILFIIINNNGIYEGLEEAPAEGFSPITMPPTSLSPKTHYELIIDAFGGKGYGVSTITQLDSIVSSTLQQIKNNTLEMPVLINVFIKPSGTTPKILSHK
ncbi:Putative oxalyl-CoA decarboxylase [Heterostelium album PN500]|uniref:2-hydroxyacyl-CoA lyase n=1 Tax=Heterostelium pallidum (strain ATCC 26659 / Pp 5 / PN500) TaxID=670386 RepID=D3AX55_HETP5|nr:Putative oxalyl-CoA decarboxylase [Heterostelium album PN500]EFA86124.1 Putative oxalyl-CoA decarboxylase [Heterostelium album PN500]|eukprot:XP_020438229.1 Putative oxalyl-CoA decarboxylase [Heterostelium album PN500]